MMKKRSFSKILLILMLAAVASLALVGCGEFSFGNYGFKNPVIDSDWRDLEYPETDIVLDGEGNESIWQNTVPTTVKDETGEVTMTTKVHFGQEGAFFLMENDDPWIFYNEDRVVYHNTSMELYVSTTNTNLTRNTVQLRFGANGYTEQWIGVDTSGKYAWTRVFVKCMSRIKIKGEINTADNEGYAIEAYMPYDQLGIDEKPDKLYVLTAFCRANNNNSESNRVGWYGGGDINAPASYFPFTPDVGYIGGEVKNSPVGDFGNYGKTSGWDLSGLADADNPSVKTMAGSEQIIYFKNVQASKYAVSVMIEHEGTINDSHPKAGILAAQNAKGMAVAMFAVEASNTHDLFAVRRPAGGEWNWPGGSSDGISRYYGNLSYSNGVKLTVVRSGVDFYYFINDNFAFANQNTMFGDDETVAGLITFGSEDTFSEFETITDATQVDDMISAVKHSDATKKWQWFGDFEAVSEDAITLKPGMANVGSNDYRADKTGVTLEDSFELSFSVSKYSYSRVVPNWMTNYLTTRLYRENGSEDQFRLRLSTHPDDTNSTTNNPAKKIDAAFVGDNKYSSTFDNIDFGGSAKKKIEIYRLVNGDKATFTVKVDGEQVLIFTSDYVGGYTFGFGNNYAAGEISDIYAGEIRGDAGGYAITETHTAGGGTVTLDKANAQMGEEVTVTITPESGHKIGAFTVNNSDQYDAITNKVYTLQVMGDTQINVTFIAVTDRTVTGTVKVSDESVDKVTGASMKFVNAEGETEVTIGNDGTYSAALSDGRYKVVATHTNTAFRKYESSITVSETTNTFDITLNGDPVIDGDLSDWTNAWKTNPVRIPATNNRSVTVYATLGEDGVYVYFDVWHTDHVTNNTTEWFMNTNVEFRLGKAGTQFYINSRNQINGVTAGNYYFNTTESSGRYHTIAEILVPWSHADLEGYSKDSAFVPAGFAFKVGNQNGALWLEGDWWRINDATPDIRNILITKKGIKTGTEKEIDGSLKDWEDETFTRLTAGVASDVQAEYSAYLGSDGMYLAVKVTAPGAIDINRTNIQGDWWQNTNLEFFEANNSNHYAAKICTFGGQLYFTGRITHAEMSLSEDEKTWIVEVFISNENLKNVTNDTQSIIVDFGGQLYANSLGTSWQAYAHDDHPITVSRKAQA